MKLKDNCNKMIGILRYKVFRNGILQEEFEGRNLIVDNARDQMAHLIAGEFLDRNIAYIAVGEGGAEPDDEDISLTNPCQKAVSGYSFPGSGQVLFDFEFTADEANGMAIREFGLFTADGKLFSRRIREDKDGNPINEPIYKNSDFSLIGEWEIIF